MDAEEFRRQGHAVIDWIAAYLEGVEQYPVSPAIKPGEVRAQLPLDPPTAPEPFDAVLADLDRVVVPGLTHWQHPSFFAYFPANSSYPAILGDLLSTGLGVNGMLWATSPACTEVETHLLDWMVELLGLPARFRSDGTGRRRHPGLGVERHPVRHPRRPRAGHRRSGNQAGVIGGQLVAYATAHTHSATEKGLRVAGIGSENLRLVAVDDTYAMRPDALAATIADDVAAGHIPFFVCATAGTTSTEPFDPVTAIAPICAEAGAWLHVDAAMCGIAALCPELRWVNDGLENVDSYCTNPHKWMGVTFDCDLLYVADRRALIDALSILPPFLRTAEGDAGAVIDYRDWQVPLGRRFRSLKLWSVLRVTGVEAIQAMIRDHVEWTQELAAWVAADPRFEIVAPHPLNLLCLRLRAGDDATEALIAAANASGQALFTRTVLDGRSVLRFCVGGQRTQRHHVEAGWRLLQELASDLT